MLLLVFISIATIFYPTLSQPARSAAFDEGDYPFPFFRDRSEWIDAPEHPLKAVGNARKGSHALKENISAENREIENNLTTLPTSYNNEFHSEKFSAHKTKNNPGGNIQTAKERAMQSRQLARRQFVIDPIGGGYLLRRQTGYEPTKKNNLEKKNFPVDPIGGGYLLKRDVQDAPVAERGIDLSLLDENSIMSNGINGNRIRLGSHTQKTSADAGLTMRPEMFNDEKPRRSQTKKFEILLRLIPKDEAVTTLATDQSLFNSKDLNLVDMGPHSFPIDPIGGGLLLGRSINYDKNVKSHYPQEEEPHRQMPTGNYYYYY